jgi:hypothetical protein
MYKVFVLLKNSVYRVRQLAGVQSVNCSYAVSVPRSVMRNAVACLEFNLGYFMGLVFLVFLADGVRYQPGHGPRQL